MFRRRPKSTGCSLTDVCVLLFLLALVATAGARAVRNLREQASRITCASNLRQVGQAIQIYANENKGAFPRTSFNGAANPVPTFYTGVNAPHPFGPGGPGPNDVTAPLFLLLRTTDSVPEMFVCPMSDAAKLLGNVKTRSNFPGRANVTYGYTNPYPSAAARQLGYKLNYTLNSDFAVAADMGRGPDVGTVAADAPRQAMMRANSPYHGGDGQNVLYADGHVDWSPTIFCGPQRPIAGAPKDNIYAYGVDAAMSKPSTGIVGAPQDPQDSVILPTADMGPQPGPLPAPGSASGGLTRQRMLIGVGAAVLLMMVVVAAVVVTRSRRPDDRITPPPPLPPRG